MTPQYRKLGAILALLSMLAGCRTATRPEVQPKSESDSETTWYYFDWMSQSPYAPTFRVRDTESSLGPYAEQSKTITMKDLVKMHGHPCDGLITAACAMSVGLNQLYPDGVIDRTDTCCITNNSPCFGDAAAYLTGGRIRFGTQKIDPSMGIEFIVYRISTGRAVRVSARPGVFPTELAALENKIRRGDFTVADMEQCQAWQWDYARALLQKPLSESFDMEMLEGFSWEPDPYPHIGTRGDIANKNVDHRSSPNR